MDVFSSRSFAMRLRLLVVLCGLLAGVALQAADPAIPSPAGSWTGKLRVAGTELPVVLRNRQEPDGSWSVKVDCPDQGVSGIAAHTVTYNPPRLQMEFRSFGASYDGTINLAGTRMEGNWKQSHLSLPLGLDRNDKALAASIYRPQEPQSPLPYYSDQVEFDSPKAKVRLAGTLTVPDIKPPYPALLLISGAGAQDRDETVAGHKPFLILADHLTRHGIAVLRVDDRGVGGSTGTLAGCTTHDLVEDVLAGVEFLKARKDIDPKRIGLLGHGEGGLIAPLAAVRSTDVAFIVLWAGPVLPGRQVITSHMQQLLKGNNGSEKQLEHQKRVQEQLYKLVDEIPDPAELAKKARVLLEAELTRPDDGEKRDPETFKASMERQIQSLTSPWMRNYLKYDPLPTLRQVKCPVLAIYGEKDVQVSARDNLPIAEEALKAAGNKSSLAVELPGLNHLFQFCTSGAPAEYSRITETLHRSVTRVTGDWIEERVKIR